MPATGELVLGTVYAQRFETITKGRARGVENVMSHYRKGVAGDWINHFTRQHAEAFEASFGDLLTRLGYEEDSDWIGLTRDSV
jgi:restriction endonuclease Mrr